MNKTLPFLLVSLSLFFSGPSFANDPGVNEIKVGKWAGYLKIEGASDAIALKMDSYYVKPNSVKDFQFLRLTFKLSFGGYLSPEYEVETFDDLQYDWYAGVLTLDEPKNQMVVRATVTGGLRPKIEGTVEIRNSTPPVTGKIYLQYRGDGPADWDSPEKLMPSLSGQYEGQCGRENAVLQIESAKGLTPETPLPTTGLHHYRITAGIGLSGKLCTQRWCLIRAYSEGSYDFFQGKLYLKGKRRNDECSREGEDLICLIPIDSDKPQKCTFRKVRDTTQSKFKIYPREFSLSASEDQLKPLPPSGPNDVKDLAATMGGTFFGYLHHEYLNRYQPIQLKVISSISTDNTHNQNEVFVSVSSVQYFGRGIDAPLLTNAFDRRASSLVLGYLLDSEESDAILQVIDWKKGVITGVWYSRGFGRVGTFEVMKGPSLPPLDSAAKTIATVSGNFQGPEDNSPGRWKFKTLVPKQPRGPMQGSLIYQVDYRLVLIGGVSMGMHSSQGTYDLYTRSLSWTAEKGDGDEPRLVTGFVEEPDRLKLFWPGARHWSIGFVENGFSDYPRVTP